VRRFSFKFLLAATLVPALAQSPDGETRVQALERRLAADHKLLNDWGGLIHYGSDNSEVKKPAANEDRVVFLGDDITELWGKGNAAFFPGKPFLNRGIAGQTSAQMLVRFRLDVIGLKPKVVVISTGTNDLLVSEVIRRNELQVWFLSAHLTRPAPLSTGLEAEHERMPERVSRA